MNGWTQVNTDGRAHDEKIPLYSLLVAIIGVLVAIIGIGVAILVPNIRQSLGISSDQSNQSDETSKQTYLILEAKETANRELQAELEKVKAAKDAAEQRAKQAEERANQAEERAAVWQIAKIENHTRCDIYYETLRSDGSWEGTTIKPGVSWTHWKKNNDIRVKYSYCLNGRPQERVYTLNVSKVVGHEPTESERSGVPVNYFAWNNSSELVMYQK